MLLRQLKKVTLEKENIYTGYYGENKSEYKDVDILKKDNPEEYDLELIKKILHSEGDFKGWVPTRRDRSRLVIILSEQQN